MATVVLNESDRATLAEYEKIVMFAKQVMDENHPPIKIPRRVEVKEIQPQERQSARQSDPRLEPPRPSLQSRITTRAPITVPIIQGFTRHVQTQPCRNQPVRNQPVQTQIVQTKPRGGPDRPRYSRSSCPGIAIDYDHNYYKDLGLNKEDNLSMNSIDAGYSHKKKKLARDSRFVQNMSRDDDGHRRQEYHIMLAAVHKAFRILSDTHLRLEYDRRYTGREERREKRFDTRMAGYQEKEKKKEKNAVGRPIHGEPVAKYEKPQSAFYSERLSINRRSKVPTPTAPRAMIARARPNFFQSQRPRGGTAAQRGIKRE